MTGVQTCALPISYQIRKVSCSSIQAVLSLMGLSAALVKEHRTRADTIAKKQILSFFNIAFPPVVGSVRGSSCGKPPMMFHATVETSGARIAASCFSRTAPAASGGIANFVLLRGYYTPPYRVISEPGRSERTPRRMTQLGEV